jgi:ABC-2 type transport system ATP-binding protein
MTAIIEAEGLTKVYPPSTKAVDDVSFSIDEGEIFGFLGPNGAGKTTTIKMLTTLSSITRGKGIVGGYDVGKNPNEVRRIIGLVSQDLTVDSGLTGMENLLLSARLYHVSDRDARQRARTLLELVGLEQASARMAGTYSGGMKKRLELISGLIHEPKVLFLDEPTLGLDIQTRSAMWQYINGISKEKKVTIFLTTHYLEEADSLCDRVAIIDRGQIKVSGPPSELKSQTGANILNVEVSGGRDLVSVLLSTDGVTEVKRAGNRYSIRMKGIDPSLQDVFHTLSDQGVKVVDAKIEKSSLDQVFLEVTGRTMRDEVVNPGDAFEMQARAKGRGN